MAAFSAPVPMEISADSNFEAQIASFPEDYKPYLRQLHSQYPSWVFFADKLSVSFAEAVEAQYSFPFRKAVNMSSDGISWRSMNEHIYDWSKGSWQTFDGGRWTGASREVIAYYMDPRNFLEPKTIYMFLQQSYDPNTQNVEGVKNIASGTFLANGYAGGSYVDDIMAAANESGVNPYVIAATIIIEQGNSGNSQLISGTYSGYEGYYNFFNFGASGSNVVTSGLSYAKTMGWNSRRASIIGGAKKYGQDFISKGQDTYYYKDFNVRLGDYSHQYAQNVYDARSSAALLGRKYTSAGINPNVPMHFYIPVYSSIPDAVSPRPPETNKKNNYYFASIIASGLNPSYNMYCYNYNLAVSGDTTVAVSMLEGTTLASQSSFALSAGVNNIPLTVTAQTGYTNTYNIRVTATAPCTLNITTDISSVVTFKKGDSNNDDKIDVIDLANMQKFIVGRITLSPPEKDALDTNNDNSIDVIDVANIQKHIVGRIKLW